ncbi:2-amino-4-hydroxy-6-hydroxymethyldihydropteridine diphosphokinase [Portibacter lacus]|nr:2-amino-4-hydroxy-6-hydroxymethyldihydropteridine diphosphokinase [Portibacter lacus]
MHKAILHIGSNIGNRLKHLGLCKKFIEDKAGNVTKTSAIYETEAWGLKDQKSFLNQAFEIETELDIYELLSSCQEIEVLLHRKRDIRWGPRTIDIDIIFYDDLILKNEIIDLPHPRMHERNFVLFPLSEIVPEWHHPILKKSVAELKNNTQDDSYVSL